MTLLGAALLLLAYCYKVHVAWTIGAVLLLAGLLAVALGVAGHRIGGRRHWF